MVGIRFALLIVSTQSIYKTQNSKTATRQYRRKCRKTRV